MVRYFYAWTPLVVTGAVFILALPWLGLIALMVVALAVLPAIAAGIVLVPYMLGRAISRLWHAYVGATVRPAPALSAATRQPALRKGHAS